MSWNLDMSNVVMDLDAHGVVDEMSQSVNEHNMTELHLNRTVDDTVDYDYDSSFIPLEDVIPLSIIYGLTFIIGILGNTLIILTISKYRRMRTITNVFLASLASADLLLILICVPVMTAKLLSYTWTFGEFLCKFVHYMQNVSAICSVLTLTSMSMERYYAILHPMKAKYICTISQARKVIVGIWVLAFLLAIPILFVKVHLEVGYDSQKAFWCHHNWSDETLCRFYVIYMLMLILVIPAAIMGFAYTNICREVWHVMRMRASMTRGELRNGTEPPREMQTLTVVANGPNYVHRTKRTGFKADDDNGTVKQVINMLVAVVLLFIICWTPVLVNDVLTAFGYLPTLNYDYLKPMRMTFNAMAYINSCVNPIVYGFMSKNFRESFLNALCLCRHGYPIRQMSFTQTRTTSVSLGRSFSVSTTTY